MAAGDNAASTFREFLSHSVLHNGENCRGDRVLLFLLIILNLLFHKRQDKRLLPDISVNFFISYFKT